MSSDYRPGSYEIVDLSAEAPEVKTTNATVAPPVNKYSPGSYEIVEFKDDGSVDEVAAYERAGGGFVSSVGKGVDRLQASFAGTNAYGAAQEQEKYSKLFDKTGNPQFKEQADFYGNIAQQSMGSAVSNIEEASSAPQHPDLASASAASNREVEEFKELTPNINPLTEIYLATKGLVGGIAESDDKLGLFTDLVGEQVPNMAATAVGTKGVGTAMKSLAPKLASHKAGQMTALGIGSGGGSFLSTYGSNLAKAKADGLDDVAAQKYARKRSAIQALVDAGAGATVPLRFGKSELVNVPTQTVKEMMAGGGGEYLAAIGVGEVPNIADVVMEGVLEAIGLPADIAAAATVKPSADVSVVDSTEFTPVASPAPVEPTLEDIILDGEKPAPVQSQVPVSQAEIDEVITTDRPVEEILNQATAPTEQVIEVDNGEGTEVVGTAIYDVATNSARLPDEPPVSAPRDVVDAAGAEAATSPFNDMPEPSQAQKENGNYKKGRVKIHGLDIAIENPIGSERSGIDPNGQPWSVTMENHYGYVERTKGADSEPVDVFIGPTPDEEMVYIVDQKDPITGKFDEHKILLGFPDADAAIDAYDRAYTDGGKERISGVSPMPVAELKEWLKGSNKDPSRMNERDLKQKYENSGIGQLNNKQKRLTKLKEANKLTEEENSDLLLVERELEKRSGNEPTTPIPFSPTRSDVASMPNGEAIDVQYGVAELDDLIASNTDDMVKNPAFPKDLQPRDRTRAASEQQIQQIANNLNPRLLMENPLAGEGAPIIASSGVVESGNGRVLALRRAYNQGLDTAKGYKDALKGAGYSVDGMNRPVLVRMRQTPLDMAGRQKFTTAANERTTSSLSSTERAIADSASLSGGTLSLYQGGDVSLAKNREFVRAFLKEVVSDSDMGSMIDSSGVMSQDASRRVKGALLANAYNDADLVATIIESQDNDLKTMGDALMNVAANWALMKDEANDAQINGAVDITENLIEAVNVVLRSRREGKSISSFINQDDMFSGELHPYSVRLLELFYHDSGFTKVVARDKITERLNYYVNEARKTSAGASADLLGETVTPDAILEQTRKKYEKPESGQQDFLTGSSENTGGYGQDGREGYQQPQEQGIPQGSDGPVQEGRNNASKPEIVNNAQSSNDIDLGSKNKQTVKIMNDAEYVAAGGTIGAQLDDPSPKEQQKVADESGVVTKTETGDFVTMEGLGPEFTKSINEAIENKNIEWLRGALSLTNKKSRALFTKITGVKLPKTLKGTREAIDKWGGISVKQRLISDLEKDLKENKLNADARAQLDDVFSKGYTAGVIESLGGGRKLYYLRNNSDGTQINLEKENVQTKKAIVEYINTLSKINAESKPDQETKPADSLKKTSDKAEKVVSSKALGASPSLSDTRAFMERIYNGDVTAAELKESFKHVDDAKEAIKAELSKSTIKELKRHVGYFTQASKKAEFVDAVYSDMLHTFHLDGTFSYSFGGKDSFINAVRAKVEAVTDEDISAFAEKVKKNRAERDEALAGRKKALDNPETLSEFQFFIRAKGEAALTLDQKKVWDGLVADSTISKVDKEKAKKKKVAQVEIGDTTMEIHETTHSKKGHDVFVVKLGDRVEKDTFRELSSKSERLGGYYSRYSKDGAIPGFQFTSKEAAEKFVALKDGDVEKEDTNLTSEQIANKLAESAAKAQEKAEGVLNADRLTNTHKRAAQAASTEDGAQKELALAKSMSNIAKAISDGNITYLKGVRHKVDVEMLESILRRAMYKTQRDMKQDERNAMSYSEREADNNRSPEDRDIVNAEYPYPSIMGDQLSKIAEWLGDEPGFKNISRKWKKVVIQNGDNNVVFKNPSFLEEIEKVVNNVDRFKRITKHDLWRLTDGLAEYKRMRRMEIMNPETLRAALREFLEYRGTKKGADPIKTAERALVGKKFDGYFPTPAQLAERMVDEAGIVSGDKVLEPSAGKGSLADKIRSAHDDVTIDVIEPVGELRDILKAKDYNLVESDFLAHSEKYDKIVMNPPFEKFQDVEHVQHAYESLKDGGRVVSIMSESPFFRSDKKAVEFREWLDSVGGWSEKLPDGSFKSSDRSTGVATRLVTIDKESSSAKFQSSDEITGAKSSSEIVIDPDGTKVAPLQKLTDKEEIVKKKMISELKRVFGTEPRLAVVGSITQPNGRGASGAYFAQNSGLYNAIYLAMLSDKSTGFEVVYHEGIHFLRRTGVLDDVWPMLTEMADKHWIKDYGINARYGTNVDRQEEAIAEAFRDFAIGKRFDLPVMRVFNKIKRFFANLRRALRGEGFNTWEDAFYKIAAGETKKDIGAKKPTSNTVASPAKFQASEQEDLRKLDFDLPGLGMMQILRDENTSFFKKLKNMSNKEALGVSVDEVRRALQDRMIGWRRVEESIEKTTGKDIITSSSVYKAEESFTGKVGDKFQKLEMKFKQRIVDKLAVLKHKHNVKIEFVEDYLYALHAPERNEQIAKINKKFPDGGSGMTNAEAAAIVKKVEAHPQVKLIKETSDLARSMLDEALTERVTMGLMTEQAVMTLRSMYKNYVPLRGTSDALVDFNMNIGKGFDTRGPESKRALGRGSKATDILANSFSIAEEAIIRGEKNSVFKTVYNMVEDNPNKDLWEINMLEPKQVLNQSTGLVEERFIPKGFTPNDNTIIGKINGNLVRITLKDKRLAEALKAIDIQQMTGAAKILSHFMRFLSTMSTTLNPQFLFTNAFRDIQTGLINVQEFDVKDLAKETRKGYLHALKASYGGLQGKGDTEWQKYFREMAEAGGRVSFWKIDDVDSQRTRLKKEVDLLGKSPLNMTKRGAKATLEFIENVNLTVEHAIRLSSYAAARKSGLSKAEAASIAKNITVNFNRRGYMGAEINAWYLFYNASAQGSARILGAMRRSAKVRAIVAGIMVTGILSDVLNTLMSPEDDDGELVYDKIPDYVKESNIIIMDPTGYLKKVVKGILPYEVVDDAGYIKIPMAYGYRVFYGVGRNISAVGRGAQSSSDAALNVLLSAVNNFNPIGWSDTPLNTFSPTILDPFIDISENADFAGRKIMPEANPYEKAPTPDSQRYFQSVGAGEKAVAKFLNELTGGDEYSSGKVDVSPESLEHFVKFIAGGAGSTVKKTVNAAEKAWSGEEISIGQIPFLGQVVGSSGVWIDRRMAYERMTDVEQAMAKVEGLSSRGEKEKLKAFREDNSEKIRLHTMIKSTRKALAQIRKIRRMVEGSDIPSRQKKNKVASINSREQQVLDNFNRQYLKAVGKTAKDTGF